MNIVQLGTCLDSTADDDIFHLFFTQDLVWRTKSSRFTSWYHLQVRQFAGEFTFLLPVLIEVPVTASNFIVRQPGGVQKVGWTGF